MGATKGRRERIYAIIIGAVMIFSMAGFAMYSIVPTSKQTQAIEMPAVVNRQLTIEEKLSLLRSGKTLIENYYKEGCIDCLERNAVLESFANKMSGFLVLSEAVENETVFQMTSPTGKITELNENITEPELLDIFCDVSYVKPTPCLLREI